MTERKVTMGSYRVTLRYTGMKYGNREERSCKNGHGGVNGIIGTPAVVWGEEFTPSVDPVYYERTD